MTEFAHHLHFGIYPEQIALDEPGFELVPGDFHTDAETEVEIHDLGIPDVRVFVSGSWACWGPADQETDGDISLHILVHSRRRDARHIWDIYQAIEHRIIDGRILDYGTVTTDVHSEQTHVFTFQGSAVFVHETKTVDALSLPR